MNNQYNDEELMCIYKIGFTTGVVLSCSVIMMSYVINKYQKLKKTYEESK